MRVRGALAAAIVVGCCVACATDEPVVESEPPSASGVGGNGKTASVTTPATAQPPITSRAAPPTTATLPTEPTAPTTATAPAPATAAPGPGSFDAQTLSSVFGDAAVLVGTDACGAGGHGSGFFVDGRHVVTNAHVIGPDPSPTIQFRDGREIAGRLIGFDESLDIAVVAVDQTYTGTLPAWGTSGGVAEGQEVVAIGYPSVLADYDVVPLTIRSIADDGSSIRVSTGLDAGNSGSAVFAADGSVIGVARAVEFGDFQIYGLLIPADLARPAVDTIIASPLSFRSPCDDGTEVGPGGQFVAGSESVGTWIMQLGSAPLDADPAAIEFDLDRLSAIFPGVDVLFANDWPATFDIPDRVIFYVGGFATSEAVKTACSSAGLAYPDACIARFLTT